MARLPNLEKMTSAELSALRADIDQIIDSKKQEEKQALKAELAELASQSGFDIDEVLGKGKSNGKGKKVAVKYRDPKDADNTWTGRGRQPRWLATALKARGTKLDDFLIA